MKALLLLLPMLLSAQTVTQVSNTSIVATVGSQECDFSGIVAPLSVHVNCMIAGLTFYTEDTSFLASSSSNTTDIAPSVGTIGWTFTSLTSGSSFQVTANTPGGPSPAALTGTWLLSTAPPSITSALTDLGTVNAPFAYQITATNNPTNYNAVGLPTGLLINTASGLISGIPSAVAVSNVNISAANAGGTASAVLTIAIGAPAPPPPGTITKLTHGVSINAGAVILDTTGATLLTMPIAAIGQNPTNCAITDSNGNSWHYGTLNNDNAGSGVEMVIARSWDHAGSPLLVGTGHIFRLSCSGATFEVSAWNGTATSSDPLDQENRSKSGGVLSTRLRTGPVTPTANGELVITAVSSFTGSEGGSSYSIDSGFSLLDTHNYSFSSDPNLAVAYLIQTSATVVNPQWTGGNISYRVANIASFK